MYRFLSFKNYFKILLISLLQMYYSIHVIIFTLQIQKCDLSKICYLYLVSGRGWDGIYFTMLVTTNMHEHNEGRAVFHWSNEISKLLFLAATLVIDVSSTTKGTPFLYYKVGWNGNKRENLKNMVLLFPSRFSHYIFHFHFWSFDFSVLKLYTG